MGFDYDQSWKRACTARAARPSRRCLESLDPSENYKGTALEGTDAFQRQLKRFDIRAQAARIPTRWKNSSAR